MQTTSDPNNLPQLSISRLRAFPFHPILAAGFPILALYSHNLGEVTLQGVGRPLAVSTAGSVFVWMVFSAMTRNLRKGAFAATALVLMFLSYGHMTSLMSSALRMLVAPSCAVMLVVLLLALWRTRAQLAQSTAILNLVSLVLIAPSCWKIAVRLAAGELFPRPGPGAIARHKAIPPPASPDLPDIYYIILDAYGRSDRLLQFYGYDNEPFLKALEKRGFYIARRSASNYDNTPLSIASSLNMTYLDAVTQRIGRGSDDLEAARQMLDENEVAAFLRTLGYHYVFIGTGASQTRVLTADVTLQAGSSVSGFERHLLGLTAIEAVPEERDRAYEARRVYIREAFRYLGSVPSLPYPKFVFAHILAPHPPFVFGPNGEKISPGWPLGIQDGSQLLELMTPERYRREYIGQLRYVNTQLLGALDSILQKSSRPPIIIIQGDHGSRLHLNWDSLERTDLREPFSILNAYYVPKTVRSYLYDSITPVNTFRVLLTRRFGAHHAVIPDRTYYSTISRPYDFTDVTRRILR